MHEKDFASLELFITGPTFISGPCRQAALLPEFGHRDAENAKRMVPAMAGLRLLAGLAPEVAGNNDYELIILNGSGSTALEAAVRSLVADGDTVLSLSMGAFGDLFRNIAVWNGKNVVSVPVEPGQAVEPAVLRAALEEHNPSVVLLTHNETSTGVVNDIAELCGIVNDFGALPLVDGVSIFAGTPLDLPRMRPAMYCTATQKGLALPAGFGIGFVDARARDKAATVANKGYASDILKLLDKARKFQTLSTPNTTLVNQLCVQVERITEQEGIKARFARHETMREMAHAWVVKQPGCDLFAPEGHRSPTLTCVQAPEGVTRADLADLKETMRGHGYLFDPGYGKLNTNLEAEGKRVVFRIGHMGDTTPAMLEKYLDILSTELLDLEK